MHVELGDVCPLWDWRLPPSLPPPTSEKTVKPKEIERDTSLSRQVNNWNLVSSWLLNFFKKSLFGKFKNNWLRTRRLSQEAKTKKWRALNDRFSPLFIVFISSDKNRMGDFYWRLSWSCFWENRKSTCPCCFFSLPLKLILKLYLTMWGQFLSSLPNSFLPRLLDISWGKYFAFIEEGTWFYLDNSSLALGWQQKGQALHMLNNIPQWHKHTDRFCGCYYLFLC